MNIANTLDSSKQISKKAEIMKKFIFVILTSVVLMANFAHATYIGEGRPNDNPRKVMERMIFADDVKVSDGFFFNYEGKANHLENWDGGRTYIGDDFYIEGTTTKDVDEYIGGNFWVNPESGIEFISLKAGSAFAFYSLDNPTGSWLTTDDLGGAEISHISIWKKSDTGTIDYPGGDGGAQVPEPATIFLLGSGLLGLFGYRKKFWKPKN